MNFRIKRKIPSVFLSESWSQKALTRIRQRSIVVMGLRKSFSAGRELRHFSAKRRYSDKRFLTEWDTQTGRTVVRRGNLRYHFEAGAFGSVRVPSWKADHSSL